MTPLANRPPPLLAFALWCAVALLVAIGVVAALGRARFPADLTTRAEPFRQRLMRALDRDDPLASQRPAELDRIDRRFARHPVATRLHVLAGGLFLVLAPLQFSSRIRSRHIKFHRWSGRLLVVTSLGATLSGLFFGLLMPYGGGVEAAAIALFGGFSLLALTQAIVAIRRGQVARHREWMIRAFAVAIGVSTVRVVGAGVDAALTPAAFGPPTLFVLSLWGGWVLTVGAAELWIAYTRPSAS